jgi:uncharacterized protein (TIGR03000 family)
VVIYYGGPVYSNGCAGTIVPGPAPGAGNGKKKMEDEDKGKGEDKDGKKKLDDDDGDEINAVPAMVMVKAATDVKVTFNGVATNRRSEEEVFLTPDLRPGRTYAYQVKAEAYRDGKKVTRTRRVLVRAGTRSRVDFSDMGTAVASNDGESARVTVLLPQDTRLYIAGKAYGTTSKQTFTTPRLKKGKSYHYSIKAERLDDGQADVRRVNVQAGKEVTVDFRQRNLASADR